VRAALRLLLRIGRLLTVAAVFAGKSLKLFRRHKAIGICIKFLEHSGASFRVVSGVRGGGTPPARGEEFFERYFSIAILIDPSKHLGRVAPFVTLAILLVLRSCYSDRAENSRCYQFKGESFHRGVSISYMQTDVPRSRRVYAPLPNLHVNVCKRPG
jgi:hypothetical protein